MSRLPRGAWLAGGAISAALAAEMLAATGRPVLAPLLLMAVGAGGGAAVALRRRGVPGAAFCVGLGLVAARAALGAALLATPASAPLPAGSLTWTGAVEAMGTTGGGVQRAVVLVAPDGGAGSVRLYLQLPRYPEVGPGDRVRFEASLEPPPADTAFAAYLDRLGAAGSARTKAVTVLGAGDDPAARLERVRRTLGEWLTRVLPEPQAGLAAGIVVGLRERVARDVASDFTASGLSHIVAISGWNIALVGGAVAALARPLPRRRRSLAVVAVIVGYTVLAGAGASVLRAALMAGMVLLSRELGRPGRATAVLGLAVAALLLAAPEMVGDPGFQLSAAATAGLIAWSSPLTGPLARHLPARTPGWLVEALAISLAAQAATLPIVLLDFGRVSLVAPLANLAAAPLVTPVMAAGLTSLAAGGLAAVGLPHLLTLPVTAIGALLLGVLVALAHLAASLPLASVTLPEPGGHLAAAASGAALLACGTAARRSRAREALRRVVALGSALLGHAQGRPQRGEGRHRSEASRLQRAEGDVQRGPDDLHRGTAWTPRAAMQNARPRALLLGLAIPLAALLTAGLVATGRADGRFHVTVLDVGQGDAILLVGDRGSRVLVDSGPDPDRVLKLLDARLPAWDRRLDLVVLTHPHEDHAGGLALLLARYRIGALAEPGMLGPGPGYRAFRDALVAANRSTRRLAAGDRFRVDSADVQVRWPVPGSVPRQPADGGKAINNVSIVLDIRFGTRRFLLTGDEEEEIDPQLLAGGVADGRPLDLLKVAHHGSRTASTAAFLQALRPRVAVISAGAGNPYGHPAPATLERIRGLGTRTLRTDLDGSVEISSDGGDLRVSATGGRPARARGGLPAATVSALRTPFLCGLATIGAWPSPAAARPRPSSSSSPLRRASWPTAVLWPSWPRSSLPAWPPVASPWTAGSPRLPRCSMTWTSCCPATTTCAPSVTARRAPAGWPSGATPSSGERSPPTPWGASRTTPATAS